MSENKRASFGGKLSVILVAAGSAIGLGALWRFPYIAGKHGGAAFLLVFLLSVLVVGVPAMLAEFAIGRHTRQNAVGAFRAISKRWSWLGYSGVLGALLISGYYYLIAGWSLEYFFSSVTGEIFSSGSSFKEQFDAFQGSYRPLIYGVVFILLTHFIVARGVEKGIEKASKIMMPALFVILIVMAVRVAFMPGASEGYKFFLSCDFAEAFKADTIMMAIGQAFFSLSVGMGCMVTYASYFKKNNNLVSTSLNVSLLTLFVSILAGLVIFPAVFKEEIMYQIQCIGINDIIFFCYLLQLLWIPIPVTAKVYRLAAVVEIGGGEYGDDHLASKRIIRIDHFLIAGFQTISSIS